MKHLAILLFAATPAFADYSEHPAVSKFSQEPCTAFIASIDSNPSADLGLEAMVSVLADQGMNWGLLLGYDAAHDGLQGDEESTLVRLRKACAENPSATAKAILDGFVG